MFVVIYGAVMIAQHDEQYGENEGHTSAKYLCSFPFESFSRNYGIEHVKVLGNITSKFFSRRDGEEGILGGFAHMNSFGIESCCAPLSKCNLNL